MQLLWHWLVNASFGYLSLIAVLRITQEVKVLASATMGQGRNNPTECADQREL
jgi:hypothetical protein